MLIQEILILCKYRVVLLMLLTLWVGMVLAGPFSFFLLLAVSFGVASLAGSAAIMNHVFEIDIDSLMSRTWHRPLPSGRVSIAQALMIGLLLAIFGLVILFFYVNSLTAWLTLLSAIGYGVFYTRYLKRWTSQNIVIGGLYGAVPPLLGWTAVTNTVEAYPLILTSIIYVWTPAHFWAYALANIDDYKKLCYPMLPITHGSYVTRINILLYSILTVIMSIFPWLLCFASIYYLFSSLFLGSNLVYQAYKLNFNLDPIYCYNFFWFSIKYLLYLFSFLLLDFCFFI